MNHYEFTAVPQCVYCTRQPREPRPDHGYWSWCDPCGQVFRDMDRRRHAAAQRMPVLTRSAGSATFELPPALAAEIEEWHRLHPQDGAGSSPVTGSNR